MIDNEKTGLWIYFFPPLPLFVSLFARYLCSYFHRPIARSPCPRLSLYLYERLWRFLLFRLPSTMRVSHCHVEFEITSYERKLNNRLVPTGVIHRNTPSVHSLFSFAIVFFLGSSFERTVRRSRKIEGSREERRSAWNEDTSQVQMQRSRKLSASILPIARKRTISVLERTGRYRKWKNTPNLSYYLLPTIVSCFLKARASLGKTMRSLRWHLGSHLTRLREFKQISVHGRVYSIRLKTIPE